MHSVQLKPNLRLKRKMLSGFEDLQKIVVLKVVAEGVRARTHSEDWRERIPECRSGQAETADALKPRMPNEWGVMVVIAAAALVIYMRCFFYCCH